MDEILNDLDLCAANLDDILVFSRSFQKHDQHLHTLFTNSKHAEPIQVRFPRPRNFIPRIQNLINGFPAPSGTSHRSSSLYPYQDRQPTSTFNGNDKFLSAFPSPRSHGRFNHRHRCRPPTASARRLVAPRLFLQESESDTTKIQRLLNSSIIFLNELIFLS